MCKTSKQKGCSFWQIKIKPGRNGKNELNENHGIIPTMKKQQKSMEIFI